MNKKYKPIKYNGMKTRYTISIDGEIINTNSGYIISPWYNVTKNRIFARLFINGKVIKHQISRWLALAYLGDPPGDPKMYHVDHIDGNPMNNDISNLQWLTCEENIRKAYTIDGKTHVGENNGNSKITDDDADIIIHEILNGLSTKAIHDKYGYSVDTITHIRLGHTWKHKTCNCNISLYANHRTRPSRKYTTEFKTDIRNILENNIHAKCRDICKTLNVAYDNGYRCLINNIRNEMQKEGSTTIEN